MDESSQSSTASLESTLESTLESRQDSGDQSLPGREGRSKESPDSSCNRKHSLPDDGFCDERGRQAPVPDCGRAHDAELTSDLAPVTMDQGSTVAALTDCRPQADEQGGEVLDSIAPFPDQGDGSRDNLSVQHSFKAPSTPLRSAVGAQQTMQQPVQQPVQQLLSHQAEQQAHVQHSSVSNGPYNYQLRSPITISFASSSDKTHRNRQRRRKGRGNTGKPEGSRCYKADVSHVGYPPSRRPGWFAPGKQAARIARPFYGHGQPPTAMDTNSQLYDVAQPDHHATQVGDRPSHGLKHEPLPLPPTNTLQPRASNCYGSRVLSASQALRENSEQLPPIYSSGHAFQTPVSADIQPQPLGGASPAGHRSTMHQGQWQTEFLGYRTRLASRALMATPMASPRSEAHLQYMRPRQTSTLDPNCAICSANTLADPLRQYTTAAVVIEDDVYIGGNVAIFPGCIIGTGSVVEAGSVVTDNVPPFTIVSGNPARVLGDNYTRAS